MHYHLLGIAGVAMGSLAGLLRARGHGVTGSDEGVYPPMSTLLDELGIPYAQRFDPANLEPAPDVVVVGNAVGRGNPELEAVLDRGLRYTSAAALIREELLEGRHVLAVAGTHGKTTTTSLLAWLLERAGFAPSFLVGGVAENFGTSFRLTDSPWFVIEADEYDTAYFDKGPKMWHYRPRTAVVLNVEFDHADVYRDEQAYRFAFERFVNLVPRTGTLVIGWEGETERALAARSYAPVESFALADAGAASAEHPRWRAVDVAREADGTAFTVVHDGRALGRVATPLAGDFNVRNCLAAVAAASAVGAPWETLADGLATFRSVRRRLELRGEPGGAAVVDDFAHHPTAVRETIAAARQRFPGRRVIAVFEPRSYTAQRRESQGAFTDALAGADAVIVARLFRPERYDATTGLDPEEMAAALRARGVDAAHVPEVEGIVERVAERACPGDVVVVMSNGGFGGIHEKLLAALARRI
ncbi:MAG TPA: UDP-N-acetylmuramate:L-alanyl-gamma-D-glutamyl-meso-diaminopimelate ligase [Longimicrobiales bacterium]|nr:UDP-N-acetylmuramate:L-alanyl-gamma-D-glutamyl-meso-diaminopimelate ligase [Longimicrobiales bacterium]